MRRVDGSLVAVPVPHIPRVKAPNPETIVDQVENTIHSQLSN